MSSNTKEIQLVDKGIKHDTVDLPRGTINGDGTDEMEVEGGRGWLRGKTASAPLQAFAPPPAIDRPCSFPIWQLTA